MALSLVEMFDLPIDELESQLAQNMYRVGQIAALLSTTDFEDTHNMLHVHEMRVQHAPETQEHNEHLRKLLDLLQFAKTRAGDNPAVGRVKMSQV